ncbi:hypothetical protein Mal15_15940 [Stieleria maiorica]|uniref:Uncharacterized protein n=1 Tax=Stieleria maiorica TaxID=2795974 RepID=A0A5B9MD56_9BACT|nr:hypothetical protein Mal15_15940 [Stieleria maiorica]
MKIVPQSAAVSRTVAVLSEVGAGESFAFTGAEFGEHGDCSNTSATGKLSCGRRLRKNVFDHMAVNIGQTTLDAVVVIGQPRVIDAQQVQRGGV